MAAALAPLEKTRLEFTQKHLLYPIKNPLCLFSVGDTSSQHLLNIIILHSFHYIFISCLIALFLLFGHQESGEFLSGPDQWCQKLHGNKEPPATCYSHWAPRSSFPLAPHHFLVGKHSSAFPCQPAAGWEGDCMQLGPAPAAHCHANISTDLLFCNKNGV